MSTKNPKLHLCFFNKDYENHVIYEDTSLKLDAKFKLNSKGIVEEIFFCALGLRQGVYYKIKNINRCVDSENFNTPFYMIHIYKHGNEEIGNHYRFTASSTQHIQNIRIGDKGNYTIFRFNFYGDDLPIKKPCIFTEEQPETKDGAIIVSI